MRPCRVRTAFVQTDGGAPLTYEGTGVSAILDAQEAQTSPPILEKAARAILQRVKQMDADLGKHLAQDAWQVLTEHVVLQSLQLDHDASTQSTGHARGAQSWVSVFT